MSEKPAPVDIFGNTITVGSWVMLPIRGSSDSVIRMWPAKVEGIWPDGAGMPNFTGTISCRKHDGGRVAHIHEADTQLVLCPEGWTPKY